jgi:hypothetical protein
MEQFIDNAVSFSFHYGVAAVIVLIVFIVMSMLLAAVNNFRGGMDINKYPQFYRDYDAIKGNRRSLRNYLSDTSGSLTPETVKIKDLQVSTANYGGIFTDVKGNIALTPWHGTVSSEAARCQVEAGARAIVFDIWPDPSNMTQPIIACMTDTSETHFLRKGENWWAANGLPATHGTDSTYSSWKCLTRNKGNAAEILKVAVDTAFTGVQREDPFFLILNLHGILSPTYLKNLAKAIENAVSGRQLRVSGNQSSTMCETLVSVLLNKVMVIVTPDIPTGSDQESINRVLMASDMKNFINVLPTPEAEIVFRPSNIGMITTKKYSDCAVPTTKTSLSSTSLCCIQPSIGFVYTDNDNGFKPSTYSRCMATGAQFVAVNVFGSAPNKYTGSALGNIGGDPDSVLSGPWKADFGKYSFKLKK